MRETYALTNASPFSVFHLSWSPITLSIMNTSRFPVYVRIGSSDRPSNKNFTDIIAPFSSFVADPVGNRDFAILVDNSTDPNTTFPYPVTITFSSGAASSQGALSPALGLPVVPPYVTKVLSVETPNLVDFWVLDDVLPAVAVDRVLAARNGTYVGSPIMSAVIGPDGVSRAPTFNGTSQAANLFTPSLASVFNGAIGSLLCWGQLTTTKWADANVYALAVMTADNNNRVEIIKNNTNTIQADYVAGGVAQVLTGVIAPTNNWFSLMLTWNKALNRARLYFNGVQNGADSVGLGVFAGALTSAGAGVNAAPSWWFPGNLAMCALWTVELTANEALQVGTAP